MSTPGWVVVIVERIHASHIIASAEGALDLLYSDWPVTSGTAFLMAMETCAGTATGVVTREEAQAAFLHAALEAKVAFRIA